MVGGKIFDEDIYIFMWLLSAEDIPVTIFLKSFTSIQKYKYTHTCTKSMHEKENN